MRYEKLSASLVNAAVEIYLRLAYDDADARARHAVSFGVDSPIQDVLSQFDKMDSPLRAYALRLGSGHYPHMKLMLREAYYRDNFAFAVDRHDEFAFETGDNLEAWQALQQENYTLKRTIEDAWYEAGIPTLRTLREDLLSESDIFRNQEGRKILILDNDEDSGAIQQMLLDRAGYDCQWVRSYKELQHWLHTSDAPYVLAVIVDLLLTDATGHDAVRLLRSTPATENVPILVCSALPEDTIELGAADLFLRKPHKADTLLQMVNRLVSEYDEGSNQLLKE